MSQSQDCQFLRQSDWTGQRLLQGGLARAPLALTQNGVSHSAQELSEALGRLEDCGHVKRTQKQPGYNVYPLFYVRRARPYDRFDERMRGPSTSRGALDDEE